MKVAIQKQNIYIVSFIFFLLFVSQRAIPECKGKNTVIILSSMPVSHHWEWLLTVFQVHASTKATDVLRGLKGSSTDKTFHSRD